MSTPSPATRERDTSVPATNQARHDILDTFHSIGGYFIENRGQVAEGIRFYSRGNPSVGFRDDGVMFVFNEPLHGEEGDSGFNGFRETRDTAKEKETVKSAAYFLHFDGANKVSPAGKGRIPFESNLLLGSDPSKWTVGVSNYREVVYQNLYEGVDLEYYPTPEGLKYEFIVHPTAEPGAIRLGYDGVLSVQIHDGGLVVQTAIGSVIDTAPYSFQNATDEVDCRFVPLNPEHYGFACGKYDSSEPLYIDPLIFSTFLGGGDEDETYGMTLDPAGNVYLTGRSLSTDFPITPGAFDTICNWDAFVTKLNASGDVLAFSTYLGGGLRDEAEGIAVNSQGNAYVTGTTMSSDFPTTPAAFDTTFNSFYDAFVTELNPAGNALVYSTFLGGGVAFGYDYGNSIALDSTGNAYIGGSTTSSDFPTTPGAFDRSFGGGLCPDADYPCPDFFVAKLDATGSSLIYSTYIGGGDLDEWGNVAVDAVGNVYLTGETRSADFPVTPGAFDAVLNGFNDAAVVKLNPTGTSLIFSTFLGGNEGDSGLAIGLDTFGNIYVAGESASVDFPSTAGAYDTSYNGYFDAFVTKLTPGGNVLSYSTFLGGPGGNESAYSIYVSSSGMAHVAGYTESADFPVTPGAYDVILNGSCDAFLAKIDRTGSMLEYSTFIGGYGCEAITETRADSLGNMYAAGLTDSGDFPITPGAFDTSFNGGLEDAFVIELGPVAPDLVVLESDIALIPPGPLTNGTAVTVNATVWNLGDGDAIQVFVRFTDNDTSGQRQVGTDQVIPFVSRFGGTGNASVVWLAEPPGNHTICVAADPDNVIAEKNETNNVACVIVQVLPSVILKPDYVLVDPQPSMPTKAGISALISLSVRVFNGGNGNATVTATLAFYNETARANPFSTSTVRPLNESEASSRYTAAWIAPVIPGTYEVNAEVDYFGNLTEWDETNNVYTWTIEVVAGPVTSLIIGNPNYTSTATYLKSTTPLDLSVLDEGGSGINHTWYRVDNVTWTDRSSSFFLSGDSDHYVEYYSEDNVGNIEGVSSRVLRVDDTPPSLSIDPLDWSVPVDTSFTLAASDGQGCGVAVLEYKTDNGPWTPYSSPFTLSLGWHNITYRSWDHLNNSVGKTHMVEVVSPEVPPGVNAEVNYKPVVAVIFAIILLLVGVWSSKRRPWKGEKNRLAVTKAFAVTSMPFVIAEAATGVVSLLTGQLSIPPLVGVGTVVDVAIFGVGIAVAVIRLLKNVQHNENDGRVS
jgi:hypothetical protein